MDVDNGELYTVQDAARLANTDEGWIRRLLLTPGQPKLKGRKLGGRWIITGSDLRRWLEARERRELDK